MLEGMTTLGFMAAHSTPARLGLMVGGVHYRHPGCGSRRRRRSTCSPADGPGWASAPHGTRRSRARWASRSRRSANGSSCSRRRSASPTRCGRASAGPRRVQRAPLRRGTTAELAAVALAGRGSRSWSAAAASGRRCGWWPSTPTPATSSASPENVARKYAILDAHCAAVGRDPARSSDRPSRTSGRGRPGAAAGVPGPGRRPLRRAVRRRRRARHLRAQGVAHLDAVSSVVGRDIVPALSCPSLILPWGMRA